MSVLMIDGNQEKQKTIITTTDVEMMERRRKEQQGTVVESDLRKNEEIKSNTAFDELKQEVTTLKAMNTRLRTHVDKEIGKLKEEIKALKKKE